MVEFSSRLASGGQVVYSIAMDQNRKRLPDV
jgi:hypothetical protein